VATAVLHIANTCCTCTASFAELNRATSTNCCAASTFTHTYTSTQTQLRKCHARNCQQIPYGSADFDMLNIMLHVVHKPLANRCKRQLTAQQSIVEYTLSTDYCAAAIESCLKLKLCIQSHCNVQLTVQQHQLLLHRMQFMQCRLLKLSVKLFSIV
jgi:hypothetical protein